jgi:hypothetical protein
VLHSYTTLKRENYMCVAAQKTPLYKLSWCSKNRTAITNLSSQDPPGVSQLPENVSSVTFPAVHTCWQYKDCHVQQEMDTKREENCAEISVQQIWTRKRALLVGIISCLCCMYFKKFLLAFLWLLWHFLCLFW